MTCIIDGCERPRYQGRRSMCASHFMRAYRYGDPLHQPARPHQDITGRRFGNLVAQHREGNRWVCACDCGATHRVRIGDLNAGSITSCGNRAVHQRLDIIGYGAVHDRLTQDRGPASQHSCTDCGGQAAHWSYDHRDPDELHAHRIKGSPAYSLNAKHYQPRCVPCHKVYDLTMAA